ncbi:hypothetical protein [Pseudanabaena sp. PCC 6802]|uniref:hypothetical protein n=1 Tax=Pseudanabaena sp. PCC 6802 TaxID=118173 RepID=UPI000345E573|nr:hypothetical protein [Pseudanabaena sp. PCC 6802]
MELQLQLRLNASSTFFTAGGFSFDGISPANYAIFRGESNLGPITGEGVSQTTPTGRTGSLPDGTPGAELTLVGHFASTRFEKTGDLLLERGFPGAFTAYADPLTGIFHEEGVATIIGGTGRFKGATGTDRLVQDGQVVVATGNPPGSQGAIGFSQGTFIIDITLPNATADDVAFFRGPFLAVLDPSSSPSSSAQLTMDIISSPADSILAAGFV